MKNVEDIYPLSPMQQGMLFHTLLDTKAGDYLTQLTGTIEGEATLAAFREAWHEVIRRHPVLRTAFVWETLDQPLQVVHREAKLPYTQHDWRGRTGWQSDFKRFLAEDRAAGFDLAAPPLMRLTIFRIADQSYRFVWTHHHLLLDGWSLPLVMKELFSFADSFLRGRSLRLPSSRPYRDYIGWLAAQDESAAEKYWREALSGITAPTPIGAAAVEKHSGTGARTHGEVRRTLPAELTAALGTVAREHRLTLNTVVQGAWALLLHHHSAEQDIVFGATVSGRPADLAGVESMVGLFINTQPVRVSVNGELTVLPWLASLQAEQTRARQFEYCRLTSIHGWSAVPRSMPLFESIVIFENYPAGALSTAVETMGVHDIGVVETTNYPLALIAAPGSELELRFNYDRSRFEPGTIEQMAEHLTTLLEGIAADPGRRISELPVMKEAEQRLLIDDWNRTGAPFPHDRCLDALFLEQVERTPDAVAVSFGYEALTYSELNGRGNRIAAALRNRGVGPEVLVGIALDRSPEMIVAILGVLKAGGAWLPLAVDQPAERLTFLLNDARPQVLVSNAQSIARLPGIAQGFDLLDLDDPCLENLSDDNVASTARPGNLAYVIYTSGSTGRPKGVLIEHRGAVNLALAQAKLFDVTAKTQVLQFAAITFDAAVSEIFVTLLSGGTLVMPRRDQLLGPDLAGLLRESEVNVVTLPPSVLATLPEAELPALRTLVVAGEATVCATAGACDGHGRMTIGRPIDNVRVYIVDSNLRPAPLGVPGELLIGGAGVARGYLARPELTEEKFIADPFVPGTRLYRTGDRARYLADGRIEYLGRKDRQVKIRGFRIEPGEIEAALTELEPVREAVVIDREDSPGHRRLVAYVTPRNGAPIRSREIRKGLQSKLPAYMVPSAFVAMDQLPLTVHGKIDRAALPEPAATHLELEKSPAPPRNPVEEVLAGIWQQVLNLDRIGIRDDFFEMGGHSLLAMQVASRVREDLGIDLPIAAVFSCPTVAGLSDHLLQDSANRASMEHRAHLILSTAHLSDDELETLLSSGTAAAGLAA
jgi:non-ribosomal peptide synthetase component F/acyl carrier protein